MAKAQAPPSQTHINHVFAEMARSLHLSDTTVWEYVEVKKNALSLVVLLALGASVASPAYAGISSTSPLCKIPIIGKYLCAPAPGGNGGPASVPEPASLAVLAMGAGLAVAMSRRRRQK